MPVATRNGRLIYVRDVAHVRDGYPPQTNIVRRDGHRGVLMSVLKTGSASTLDIIRSIKDRLPGIRDALPPDFKIDLVGDQSIFVRAAISGVVREAVIAASLTALMILLFLGTWRSTLIIAISIPLSILASIICLSALGETINIMTLGGLALAVGILVDDATVTIENINWHLERGEDVEAAILNGAHEIAVPAFVSTLAICIVFVPMFLLAGIARYLFVPLAEAVVFAMLASYLLSRTLVPTLAKYWLQRHDAHREAGASGLFRRLQLLQRRFEKWFRQVREDYHKLLERAVAAIDETATLCDRVEQTIRELIPAREIATIVDNIGIPYSGINLAYSTSAPVGPGDADIFVNLTADHAPTAGYVRLLRSKLRALYPSTSFAFLPADMVSQILNFGLPAPIDVQVSGFNAEANRAYAQALLARLHRIPGVVDLRIQQAFDYPQLNVEVDRSKAALLGLSETDVASDLLVSLSGSSQTTLSFWIDPKSGTQYAIAAQTPQFRLASLGDLATTPVTGGGAAGGGSGGGRAVQLLANLASFHRSVAPAVVSHYDATPVVDIFGAVEGSDLGFVAAQIQRVLAESKSSLPRGSQVAVHGQ
ncbi:MAG: efflux RND transporter permease subunit, partial [Gammaproteobacteria bacterium]